MDDMISVNVQIGEERHVMERDSHLTPREVKRVGLWVPTLHECLNEGRIDILHPSLVQIHHASRRGQIRPPKLCSPLLQVKEETQDKKTQAISSFL